MSVTEKFEPLDDHTFEARETELRQQLLDAQFDHAESQNEALLILIHGPDGSGKGEVLIRLHQWLDSRTIKTLAYDINDADESRRPGGWRYWRDMPRRGRIGVVLGSWYHAVMLSRATGEINRKTYLSNLELINRTETMLSSENVRLLKIWLDLSADKAAERFRNKRKGPGSARHPLVVEWSEIDTKKERRKLVKAAEEVVEATGPNDVSWHVVPASDPRARDLAVGELVLKALLAGGGTKPKRRTRPATTPRRITRGPSALAALDLSQSLDHHGYKTRLHDAQSRLYKLTRTKAFAERGLVLAFEGNDAAGKGGAIRRLRSALDPMQSEVWPIAAPSDSALARPYLWRFWRRVPDRGQIAIFDRSWYGRVLVERVEGFASRAEWLRAYQEINDFEHQLHQGGYIVQKFWLAIDPDEQLARFEARRETPHKRFKITGDDWRNREKWPLYAAAVEDMIVKTSNAVAPWTLVEANDKRFSRVKVIETLVARLEAELQ